MHSNTYTQYNTYIQTSESASNLEAYNILYIIYIIYFAGGFFFGNIQVYDKETNKQKNHLG